MWNGSFFSNTTLTATGLVVQLGHEVGDVCPAPSSLHDLMVFDLSGVHCLVVRYCGCEAALSKAVQLFNVHWFLATINRPATAFTFNFLNFFHSLQDQNKCNPYNFYNTIVQRLNPAGLDPQIVLLLFTLFAVLSLTSPPASLQRNNTCPPPLELPPPPQARWCRILLSHR